MKRPGRALPPEEAVESFRRGGDNFSQDERLKRWWNPIYPAAVVGAILPHGIVYGIAFPIESYPGMGALLAASMGVAGITDVVTTRRETRQALANHKVITEQLGGEQTDLIRVGSRGHRELLLRWYGLDSEDPSSVDPDEVRERATKITNFAEEHNIPTIAVGAALFPDVVGRHEGPTYITDKIQARLGAITDEICADEVVELTPAELRELASRIEAVRNDSALETLISRLGDKRLVSFYESLAEHREYALANLERSTRAALERGLGDSSTRVVRSEDGTPVRQRVSKQTTLHGGHLTALEVTKDQFTGLDTVEWCADGTLPRKFGYQGFEEMIADVLSHIDEASNLELAAAIYELVRREKNNLQTAVSTTDYTQNTADVVTSLRERLYGNIAPSGEPYTLRRKHRKQTAIVYGALAGTVLAGIGAGEGVGAAADSGRSQQQAAYEQFVAENSSSEGSPDMQPGVSLEYDRHSPHGDRERYEQFAAQYNGLSDHINRALIDVYNGAEALDSAVASRFVWAMIELIGLDNIPPGSGSSSSHLEVKWLDELAKFAENLEFPPDSHSAIGGSTFVGDTKIGSNKMLYSITSPVGLPTAGYWITGSSHLVEPDTSAGAPPFSEKSVRFVERPYSTVQVALQPDYDQAFAAFEVETSHIGFYGDYDHDGVSGGERVHGYMPVKIGYDVVAAEYFDKADPSKRLPAAVFRSLDGAYTVQAPIDERFTSLRMRQPALRYKLALSGVMPSARSKLDTLDFEPLQQSEREEIATSVRQALGLSADADDEEVLAAIRDEKEYSYTPFDRAGISDVKLSSQGNDIITEMAEVIARLDTLNCNLASYLQLTATLDSDKANNLATGYLENGDGFLAQVESHAWTYDSDGQVIDPTPTQLAAGETLVEDVEFAEAKKISSPSKLPIVGSTLLGAAMTVMAWRRRREIRDAGDHWRAESVLVRSSALRGELAKAYFEVYGDPDQPSPPRRSSEPPQFGEALRQYVNNTPSEGLPRGNGLPSRVLRSTIAANDLAIRRQAAKRNVPNSD